MLGIVHIHIYTYIYIYIHIYIYILCIITLVVCICVYEAHMYATRKTLRSSGASGIYTYACINIHTIHKCIK